MKKTLRTLTVILSGLFATTAHAHKAKADPPKVQLAILLDTSNSMDGLIDQAKTQLWKVVNTFIESKKDGQVPYVEVALYEYGNTGLKPANHFIRQVQPFTRDLDQLSEDLFSLKTNGGDEYCGAVIQCAINDLKWDPSGQVYKAIFVAGNEPFTQGPIDPKGACKEAIQHGVVVNTIHCGAHQAGISGGWNQGELLAEGSYMVINQDAAVVHIPAPQDKKIMTLNKRLNGTYIPFGRNGRSKKVSQMKQDANSVANASSGAALQRVVTKASGNYYNSSWDLCDASCAKGFDWTKLKDEELPMEMRILKPEARKAYVAEKLAERKKVQAEIQTLNKARKSYVAEKRKEAAKEGSETLDQVVTKTVRVQAEKKGYQFGGK